MNIVSQIAEIVGPENVFSEHVECVANSRDYSVHEGVPDAVVYPQTSQQVSAIMKIANQEEIPVTPRGTGSSLTGAVLPIRGGILLDLHRMNKILEINKKDFYVRVEPGVVCARLNAVLAEDNLMFPPNPGSEAIATLGGMVSTNASGHRAVKYGTTRDYVKGLRVVLSDGTIIETGFRTPKNSMGYDLTHLFVNSEGTLGIITEIVLKIQLIPEYTALSMAMFYDLTAAGDAVTEIITSGIRLSACEIFDKYSLEVIKEAIEKDVSEIEAMLIMEADGVKETVIRDMNRVGEISKKYNVRDYSWTDDSTKMAEIMAARGRLVPALTRIKPGYRPMTISEDLGVPSTKIPETIRRSQQIADKHNLLFTAFGHVGDGNIHTSLTIDLRSKDQFARLKPAADELADLALEMGGTISAEHGMGLTRAPYMEKQLGPGLEVMRTIKSGLDPKNILNPGKMGLDKKKHDIYDYFAFKSLLEHPEGLNSFGYDVDNEILACINCGFCRLGCPTYDVTQLESRNARGRNILAFNLMTGEIGPSKELANSFYTCTTCNACTFFCPAQIKVDQIIQKGREKLFASGFAPEPVMALRDSILNTDNVYAATREDRIAIYPPPIKKKVEAGQLKKKADTLLFMGCVSSYLDMKIIPSFFKIMDAAGVDYTLLGKDEICCGVPLHLMGDQEKFEQTARNLIDLIKATGAKELVTPCAGCYKTFRKYYPEAGDLGVEIFHSVHYIQKLIEEKKIQLGGNLGKKITYHDPCDLGRTFEIFDEPREILKAIPDIDFIEMNRSRLMARCCGGGGSVIALEPELAADMAAVRVKDAVEVGAEIIVSGCSACKDNLRKGVKAIPKEERPKIKVMDITEAVAGVII